MQQTVAPCQPNIGAMTPGAWLHLLSGDEVHDRDPRANGPVGVFQLRGHDVVRRVVVPEESMAPKGRHAKMTERELRRDVITFYDVNTVGCSCRLFQENGLCRHIREAEERLSVLREHPRPVTSRIKGQDAIEAFVDDLVDGAENRSLDPRQYRPVHYAGGYQPKGLWADLELDSLKLQAADLSKPMRGFFQDKEPEVRILLLLLSGITPVEIANAAAHGPIIFARVVETKANGRSVQPHQRQAILETLSAPIAVVRHTLDEAITWFLGFDGPPDTGDTDDLQDTSE